MKCILMNLYNQMPCAVLKGNSYEKYEKMMQKKKEEQENYQQFSIFDYLNKDWH